MLQLDLAKAETIKQNKIPFIGVDAPSVIVVADAMIVFLCVAVL